MVSAVRPDPGEWYLDRQSGDVFQVVGTDEADGTIEIQFADGAVEEFLKDDWEAMALERCGQPEDWEGPFDDVVADDIGLPESVPESHSAEVPIERVLLGLEEQGTGELIDSEE
jgi:hypothetical protein